MMYQSLKERFSHLYTLISGERFLKKQGLGNEVPFFICAYAPQEAVDVGKYVKSLIKRLENSGIRVLHIDLYDLSVDLLKERDIWDRILDMERDISKEELKELLQGVLDPAEHLVPAIGFLMEKYPHDVIFLTGVGEVFPYIRSHNILNNLQSTAKDKPTVMFFPGEYTYSLESGASLDLFGRLHDDKYYRAFNIFQCEAS